MKDEKVLRHILHTVQMGQSGIRSVMDQAVDPRLKKEMKTQLEEYDAMEKQALHIAKQQSMPIRNISGGVQKTAALMSRMRLLGGQRDSKIAGMLIQGNTRGMIQGAKDLHHNPNICCSIRTLGQQLIAQEQASIENTKQFL